VSDDDLTPDGAEEAPSAARRTPTAAAAAASRARRIGGTVRPSRPGSTGSAAEAPDDEPVSVTKTAGAGTAEVEPAGEAGSAPATGATPEADPPAPRRTRSVPVWIPAVVLGAGALVMAVLLAVSLTGTRWPWQSAGPSGETVRTQVLSAAKACLVATNTYNYSSLDTFEKKGLACSTGTLAVQFKQTVEDVIRKDAPSVKQVQSFQVNEGGIMTVDGHDRWDVLLYGQVLVKNSSNTTGRTDPYGAVARMELVHGVWKMSELNTVCSLTLLAAGNKCT
jgi:hypothetical protein